MRLTCQLVLIASLALAGGCNPPQQSEACARYVACQQAWDAAAGHRAKDTADYAAAGRCWTTEPIAAQCTLECTEGTAALTTAAEAAQLDVSACR